MTPQERWEHVLRAQQLLFDASEAADRAQRALRHVGPLAADRGELHRACDDADEARTLLIAVLSDLGSTR